METPYVVMFQAVNILSGEGGGFSGKCGPKIQECWTFEHPRKDPVLDFRGKSGPPLILCVYAHGFRLQGFRRLIAITLGQRR